MPARVEVTEAEPTTRADSTRVTVRGMTPGGTPGVCGRQRLEQTAPRVASTLEGLLAAAPVELDLVSAIRRRCGEVLEVAALSGTASSPAGRYEAPAVVLELADRFSTDVSQVDEPLRERLMATYGGDVLGVVLAIWIADMVPRARTVLDSVHGPTPAWDDPPLVQRDPAEVWAMLEDLLREVHRLDRLDPVLSEAVRLHGARGHRCRLCMSLRSRPALAAGATEDLLDAIGPDRRGELPPRLRVALDVVDAVIWHPARVSPELVAAVHRHFEPAESVELVLDVVRNAANKIAVALGADEPHVADGIEVYEVDTDGVAHYGLPGP